jgi:hypothetical protein
MTLLTSHRVRFWPAVKPSYAQIGAQNRTILAHDQQLAAAPALSAVIPDDSAAARAKRPRHSFMSSRQTQSTWFVAPENQDAVAGPESRLDAPILAGEVRLSTSPLPRLVAAWEAISHGFRGPTFSCKTQVFCFAALTCRTGIHAAPRRSGRAKRIAFTVREWLMLDPTGRMLDPGCSMRPEERAVARGHPGRRITVADA